MADADKHSRTEKPTARRKKEARRDGQVARTPEVITWLVIMSGSYLVQHTVKTTYAFVDRLWYQVADAISHPSLATDMSIAGEGGRGVLSNLAPAVLATMVLALVANLAQTRGLITFKPLKPSFSHLNPAKGLKRLFSPRSAWEAAKQAVRVCLLSLVAWKTVSGFVPVATAAGPLSSTAIASMVATRALTLTRQVAGIGLGLAVLDYVVQYRKTARQLRMTRQEVKEDSKSSEGSPYMRNAIRRRQRQLSRNRMLAAVAGADAVVLNPTHFAVAVSYVRGRGAPEGGGQGSRLPGPAYPGRGHRPPGPPGRGPAPGPGAVRRLRHRTGNTHRAVRGRRPPAHLHLLAQDVRARHPHRRGAAQARRSPARRLDDPKRMRPEVDETGALSSSSSPGGR